MNVIGTCSLCGGAVCSPERRGVIVPPTPSCTSCRAVAANHGPVIPMRRVDSTVKAWGKSDTRQDKFTKTWE